MATEAVTFQDYESLVTLPLNDLSRSMGLTDVYPFAPSPRVHEKLRFVHDIIRSHSVLTSTPSAQPARHSWLRRALRAA